MASVDGGVTPLAQMLTFACGAVTGIAFTACFREPVQEMGQRVTLNSTITADEAEQKLEQEGKLCQNLSPADNAANILESVLRPELDIDFKAAILYAVKVLRSDLTDASVPVALDRKEKFRSDVKLKNAALPTHDTDDENQEIVMHWLLSSFTSKTKITAPKPKLSFKLVAKKVKLALKFSNFLHQETTARAYIYDVEPSEMKVIEESLNGIDEWDWEVWKLDEATNRRPLQTLGWHLLHKWGLVSELKLDEAVLRRWLVFVESMYKDTQYHSSVHATDVLQAVHFFLNKAGASEYFTHLRIFAILITAMIHDAGHDGRNNAFHENAFSDRAIMFNDQSIQENFHCMTVFSHMSKMEDLDILLPLGKEQAREVRRLMVLMTLGTDMKNHFKGSQRFKSLIGARGSNCELWAEDAEANDELCSALLHAADLSNPCRPFPTARRWASKVLEEFFAQGDDEERMGLPVSPLCSRNSTPFAKSQVGFIGFVVLPYFQMLEQVFPKLSVVRALLESNHKRWKELEAEEAANSKPTASTTTATTASPPGLARSPSTADKIGKM